MVNGREKHIARKPKEPVSHKLLCSCAGKNGLKGLTDHKRVSLGVYQCDKCGAKYNVE